MTEPNLTPDPAAAANAAPASGIARNADGTWNVSVPGQQPLVLSDADMQQRVTEILAFDRSEIETLRDRSGQLRAMETVLATNPAAATLINQTLRRAALGMPIEADPNAQGGEEQDPTKREIAELKQKLATLENQGRTRDVRDQRQTERTQAEQMLSAYSFLKDRPMILANTVKSVERARLSNPNIPLERLVREAATERRMELEEIANRRVVAQANQPPVTEPANSGTPRVLTDAVPATRKDLENGVIRQRVIDKISRLAMAGADRLLNNGA